MSLLSNLSEENRLALIRQRAQQLQAERSQISLQMSASDWIERYFWIPELKGPMHLYPYQKAVLDYALTPDQNGNFKYSTVVWSDIKKSAKSSIAAAVGLWVAYRTPWGSVYAVANDLKQADSRVGYYARRAVELNQTMKIGVHQKGYRLEFPNRAFTESIPIDPTGEAGSNADMVIFSELWGAHEDAQQRMWVEMTVPPTKFGKSFRWVETYAGYLGESNLLHTLYELGIKHGARVVLPGFEDLELYENRPARTLVLWNTRPRLPWQTPEYYLEQEAVLPPNEYLRIHRNQWVSPQQEFIPAEWWHACHWQSHNLSEFPLPQANTPMVFAIDAGLSNDYFAIVGVWRKGDKIIPHYVRRWIPPRNGKLDFGEPEAEIRRLCTQYNIVEWTYDEYQLHDMTTRLRRDGLGWFKPFPQQTLRAIADKLLYDTIASRNIIHDGNNVLEEALRNADAKIEGDKKLRLVKRSASMHIDPAVALSMANHEALRLNLE